MNCQSGPYYLYWRQFVLGGGIRLAASNRCPVSFSPTFAIFHWVTHVTVRDGMRIRHPPNLAP